MINPNRKIECTHLSLKTNLVCRRRISRDPIGESGWENLYGYVLNNPIGQIDLFGLAADCPCKSGLWTGDVHFSVIGLMYVHGSFQGEVTCTSDSSLKASVSGAADGMGIQVGKITGDSQVGFLASKKSELMNQTAGIFVGSVGLGVGPINLVSVGGNMGSAPGQLIGGKTEFGFGPSSDASVLDFAEKPKAGLGAAFGFIGLRINQVK